ncbi:MAG: hypothetical protein AMJ46_06210 [Latescibacteria bacterium DG_63]|nr:MAG: hypothetical protein AMJ46_06210 [Latescibacteria bacterium DG_63]
MARQNLRVPLVSRAEFDRESVAGTRFLKRGALRWLRPSVNTSVSDCSSFRCKVSPVSVVVDSLMSQEYNISCSM